MSTPISMMQQAERVLRDTFGFPAFRPGQQDIVSAVLSGRDVLGVLPTGGGKSLCYQVPALVFPKLTLVVSPLIALMQDQTERLRSIGVEAYSLHSGMGHGEVNDIIHRASMGKVKLLYVAPERLESRTFRNQLQMVPLSLLAVDEAHCISEWGHDFRPSYRTILSLFESRQRVPVVAVTATATPDVRRDVIAALQLRSPVEIVRGFARSNLTLKVEQTAAKVEYVTRAARELQYGSMIIYCASRRRVDTLVEELNKRGVHSVGYHGGMTHQQRAATQDAFLNDNVRILAATNAFGMGVDKSDVRQVIHTDLTLTLEAYYQEAGRAGRDGNPATCTLLYQSEDKRLMDFYVSTTYPEQDEIGAVYDYLCSRAGLQTGESSQTPIMADSASIASALHTTEASIRGVMALLERSGVLLSTTAHGNARITLRTSRERIAQFAEQAPPEFRLAVQLISRHLNGRIPGEETDFPVVELLRRSDVTSAELSRALSALQLGTLIRYNPPNSGGGILLLGPRVRTNALEIDFSALQQRRDRAKQKLSVMIGYAESRQCKRNVILSYFGDQSCSGSCGTCSSCVSATGTQKHISQRMAENINAAIVAAWQTRGRFGRHVIVDIIRGVHSPKVKEYRLDRSTAFGVLPSRTKAELLETIDVALDAGWLVKTADLYPTIGVTGEGKEYAGSLPKQITLQRSTSEASVGDDAAFRNVYAMLVAMRERIASQRGVPEHSLCSNDEIAMLAHDMPMSLKEFVPGRHGSSIFLTQHAQEILTCIQASRQQDAERRVVSFAPDIERIVGAIHETTTLDRLSRDLQMSKPSIVELLQRGIESGIHITRGSLVDESLFTSVLEYVRYHRYAKLRDVRQHIGGEPSVPELRLALAFARRDLYSEAEPA
jgi:ATP-dependent DNA helicase RecQ